jgi:hypothetical protein
MLKTVDTNFIAPKTYIVSVGRYRIIASYRQLVPLEWRTRMIVFVFQNTPRQIPDVIIYQIQSIKTSPIPLQTYTSIPNMSKFLGKECVVFYDCNGLR